MDRNRKDLPAKVGLLLWLCGDILKLASNWLPVLITPAVILVVLAGLLIFVWFEKTKAPQIVIALWVVTFAVTTVVMFD